MKNRFLILPLLAIVLSSCDGYIPYATTKPITLPATEITPEYAEPVLPETLQISAEDVVQLAWFYKPPEDGTPLSVLAEQFDSFVLTHYDEAERDELRELGVNAPILEYLLLAQIQDPGSCDKEPYGNQVAYKTGDFCTLTIDHPDWFLRDNNGNLIRNGRNVFMDPGNAGYQEFWLDRAQELQEEYHWDGVFIDNVEASLNKFRRLGQMPANYASDESYQKEIETFLSYISTQYFTPHQRPVYGNIVEYKDKEIWLRYLNHLDGVMIEDFAVDYNERYYFESNWEKQIFMSMEAETMGKALILVSQSILDDTDRARFSFVSYLLINNGLASFRYTGSGHYEEVWLYENYFQNLGSPTGSLYEWHEGWRRDFTNGYVFLDPSTHTSEINIVEN